MVRTTVNHPAIRLRTRPIVPLVREEAPARRCLYCRAKLWSGNPDPVCMPCQATGREVPEAEPVTDEAPECACGCGERTLRAMSKKQRTGPYQKYVFGHVSRMQGKGVKTSAPQSREAASEDTTSQQAQTR